MIASKSVQVFTRIRAFLLLLGYVSHASALEVLFVDEGGQPLCGVAVVMFDDDGTRREVVTTFRGLASFELKGTRPRFQVRGFAQKQLELASARQQWALAALSVAKVHGLQEGELVITFEPRIDDAEAFVRLVHIPSGESKVSRLVHNSVAFKGLFSGSYALLVQSPNGAKVFPVEIHPSDRERLLKWR